MDQINITKRPADTNVVLIGFMGSGKSTYAKKLAKAFKRTYVDTDLIIESEQKLSCKEIFEKYGEEHFRRLEMELLKRLSKEKNLVIATGGGFANLTNLKQMGLVVWLYLSYERTKKRLSNDSKRPLWNDEAKKLFDKRFSKYQAECDLKLNIAAFGFKAFSKTIACFIECPYIEAAKLRKIHLRPKKQP